MAVGVTAVIPFIFLGASALAATAPASGPAPFLTQLQRAHGQDAQGKPIWYLAPTQERIERPFQDVPFALNIPFEVPFDGGAVRLYLDINLVWEEAERRYLEFKPAQPGGGVRGENWVNLYPMIGGLFRMDGSDVQGASHFQSEFDTRPDPGLKVQESARPIWINTGGSIYQFAGRMSGIQRPPFADATWTNLPPGNNYLLLKPAKPGWYCFWIAFRTTLFPPSSAPRNLETPTSGYWPDFGRPDDSLRALFQVHTLVARHDPPLMTSANEREMFPSRAVTDFLFRKVGPRPAVIVDEKLFSARSSELPLTIRRDGWVFVRAQAVPTKEGKELLDTEMKLENAGDTSADEQFLDVKSQVLYTSAGGTLRLKRQQLYRDRKLPGTTPIPYATDAYEWNYEFPRELPDLGASHLQSSVTRQRLDNEAVARQRKLPLESPLYYGRPEMVAHHKSATLYNLRWAPLFPLIGRGRPEQPRGSAYQEAESKQWFSDQDSSSDQAASVPWRVRFLAEDFPWGDDSPLNQLPSPNQVAFTNAGPLAVLKLNFGPWIVEGHFRRRKDPEPSGVITPRDPGTRVVDEKDPFWEWYVTFDRFLRERLAKVKEAQVTATTLGWELQPLLHLQQRLSQQIQEGLTADTEAHAQDQFGEMFFADPLSRHLAQADGVRAEALLTPSTATRIARQRQRLETERVKALRTDIDQLITDARKAHEEIVKELDRGLNLHGADPRHFTDLRRWRKKYQELGETVAFELAQAAGDPQALQAALDEAKSGGLSANALVTTAQLARDNGDMVGSLFALRDALAQEPKHAQAADLLRQAESALIQSLLQKSAGALRNAHQAFSKYLDERGFPEVDRATRLRGTWYGALYRPIGSTVEQAWQIFTTGAMGALSGIGSDSPLAARAQAHDASLEQFTRAWLGAQTVLRLRLRGHPLGEIATMDAGKLRAALPLQKTTGEPYTTREFNALGTAIHEALGYPELKALVDGDRTALAQALESAHWDQADAINTWAEWFFDITSMKNLGMLLLPMSKANSGAFTGNRWFWNAQAQANLARGVESGEVLTGSHYLAQLTGLERTLRVAGGRPVGKSVLALLERKEKWEKGLSTAGSVSWTISKLVGTMLVQGYAINLTHEHLGPEAAFALEGLLLLSTDHDLVAKLLRERGVKPEIVARAVRRALPEMDKAGQAVIDMEEVLIDGERVWVAKRSGVPAPVEAERRVASFRSQRGRETPAAVASANPTPPANRVLLLEGPPQPSSVTPAAAAEFIPGDDSVQNARFALNQALGEVENGVNSGALENAAKFKPSLQEAKEELAARAGRARQLATELEQTAESVEVPGFRTILPERDLPTHPEPPRPAANSPVAALDDALEAGDRATAAKKLQTVLWEYEAAADAGIPLRVNELPKEQLQIRAELIAKLRPKPAAGPGPQSYHPPILEDKLDDYLQLPRRKRETQGSFGTVSDITTADGHEFVVKESFHTTAPAPDAPPPASGSLPATKPPAAQLPETVGTPGRPPTLGGTPTWSQAPFFREVEGEVVSAAIRRALGLETPAMRVRLTWKDGQLDKVEYLYRRLKGPSAYDAEKVGVHELYALREEFARDRTVAVLLGDYDRHIGNYIVQDGHLVAIDGGIADPRGWRYGAAPDHPRFVEGDLGLDHWHRRSHLFQKNSVPETRVFGERQFLVESAMRYNHAKPMVDKVASKLSGDAPEIRAALEEAYTSIFKQFPEFANNPEALRGQINRHVNEALETMRTRSKTLEKTMKHLDERRLGPAASIWRPESIRGLAATMRQTREAEVAFAA